MAARSSPWRIAVSTCSRSHDKSVFRWLRISGELKFLVSGSCPCNRYCGFLLTITSIASNSPCKSPSSSNGAPRYGMMTSPMNITLSSGRLINMASCVSPPRTGINSNFDRHVWFVATNILRAESLSEKRFAEDVRPVEFLFELFLIVASTIKLGTRVQAAEVRMTADMVPVCVSNEHSCQRRQSRRKGLQRFVCAFCEVRACARVNANELISVLGDHKIIFREFEAGQRVDTIGNDLCNAPRGKG